MLDPDLSKMTRELKYSAYISSSLADSDPAFVRRKSKTSAISCLKWYLLIKLSVHIYFPSVVVMKTALHFNIMNALTEMNEKYLVNIRCKNRSRINQFGSATLFG